MTLTDLIISLNGQYIIGKDSKRYVIEIPGKNTIGTIYISDAEDRSSNGFIPDLRDLGDTLYQAGVAEFMRVSNQGIYKSLIRMTSEVVPAGTKYKSSIFNPQDQDALLDYVKETDTLDLRDALEETCFGHILQASEFSNVQLFYKDQNGINEGIGALQRFNEEKENGIYTSSHETDLFLIGTKKPKPHYK